MSISSDRWEATTPGISELLLQSPSANRKWRRERKRFADLRLQLARELHDRAGWHLSALNYGLLAVELEPDNNEIVRELRQRLDALTASLREITTDFRHGLALRSDLVAELSSLGAEWTGITRIQVVISNEIGDVQLRRKIGDTIVSVAREALTNIAKHAADTTCVRITLSKTDDQQIVIAIADDGPGIDLSKLQTLENHHGLVGMAERLGLIGGVLRIERGPGSGTQLFFEIAWDGAR